jgi:hypothetical protein
MPGGTAGLREDLAIPLRVELAPGRLSNRRFLGLQLAFALHDDHVWALEADKDDAVPVHEVDGLVIVAWEHLGRIRYDDSPAAAGQIDDHGRLS